MLSLALKASQVKPRSCLSTQKCSGHPKGFLWDAMVLTGNNRSEGKKI